MIKVIAPITLLLGISFIGCGPEVKPVQNQVQSQSQSQPLVHHYDHKQVDVVRTDSTPTHNPTVDVETRSKMKSAAIIAGSSGAGAAIGAIAGGGKGAAIGAIAGGVSGFIYDRETANHVVHQ